MGTDSAGPAADRLIEVVRELADAETIDDVARIVRTAARALTGADGATFVLRDGDDCHYVDEDAISPLWKGRRFPMETCISGWAMLHRRPVVIEDIYVDDRIPHDAYRPTFVRSLVMVPIRTADPIGAIGNYWAERRRPTTEEVEILQALADSTAVALRSVRSFESFESQVAARTEELREANEDLRYFTAAVAHDLRSPLTAIRGFADLLLGPYGAEPEPALVRESATVIRDAADSMTGYVTDLLAFASADTKTLALELVSIDALVAEVRPRLEAQIRQRDARLELDASVAVRADRVLVGQVLQNLIANAIAYAPAEVTPRVRVTCRVDGVFVVVCVTDNGPGIPASEREMIFEPFRRGSTSSGQPGTGLGLALCRRVAERHGGTIELSEEPPPGATFVLRLPC